MWAEWLGRKGGLRTESGAAEYHGAGAASGRWWRERDRDRERRGAHTGDRDTGHRNWLKHGLAGRMTQKSAYL